jgi:hypothetical protein
MSIATVEIRAFSGPDLVELGSANRPAIIRLNVGPAGPAGPNSVTSSTTSDGTANLEVLSVVSTSLESTMDTVIGGSLYFQADNLTQLQPTATETRSILFPNASGTIALTSDITNSVTSATTSDGTAELSLASIQAGSEDGIIFKNQIGDTIGVMADAGDGSGSGFAFGEASTAQGGISFALGETCTASGARSFAGGVLSTASSEYSRAIGTQAKAIHIGASVESDSEAADVQSTAINEKTFRFANGYRFLGGSATFSAGVTVTGTLTADHIHGNLAGSVYAHVRAGETLAKGDPVYISGSHGSGSTLIPIVSKADASNAAKMPAVGIMDAALANNATGHMVITGTITELNTNAYAVNSVLYVATGGGFTATPPAANSQPVAIVERANTNNGAVIVKVNGLASSGGNGASDANKLVRFGSAGTIPVASIGGLGTGVATALAVNTGSAGAIVVNGGALGTPSSGALTSCTGLPISTGVSGLGTNVAAFLATPSSANLAAAVTDETGTGSLVFGTSPSMTNVSIANASSNTRATLVSGMATSVALIQIQGTTTSSYSSMSFLDSAGTQRGSFGFGGSAVSFGYVSTVYFEAGSGIPVAFGAGGAERMRIISTGEVGIGTSSPSTKSVLDLTSTTKGFLPPRMTTAQRDAITSVPAGLMIYNTTTNKLNFYNGSAWEAVTSA